MKNYIIAGSRTFTDYVTLDNVCMSVIAQKGTHYQDITIVSGGAKGADTMAETFARMHNLGSKVFPADWNTFGKSAGYKRNVQMAEVADTLIAFWDGLSKGTSHMIDIAKDRGLDVWVYNFITKTMNHYPTTGVDLLQGYTGKGKLICCGVPDIGKYRSADIKLFAVRSLGKVKPGETKSAGQKILDTYDMIHAAPLSPSTKLFFDYLDWKKKGVNNWFGDLYTPRFIEEMRNSKEFQKWIKRIMLRMDEGKSVLLACWCHSPLECHRSIIAYFMQQKGYEVVLK